jgi:AraC-like DNA-binding protein
MTGFSLVLTVGLVAEQCGFTNRSTFTRLFREQYSMTPTEYRKAAM